MGCVSSTTTATSAPPTHTYGTPTSATATERVAKHELPGYYQSSVVVPRGTTTPASPASMSARHKGRLPAMRTPSLPASMSLSDMDGQAQPQTVEGPQGTASSDGGGKLTEPEPSEPLAAPAAVVATLEEFDEQDGNPLPALSLDYIVDGGATPTHTSNTIFALPHNKHNYSASTVVVITPSTSPRSCVALDGDNNTTSPAFTTSWEISATPTGASRTTERSYSFADVIPERAAMMMTRSISSSAWE